MQKHFFRKSDWAYPLGIGLIGVLSAVTAVASISNPTGEIRDYRLHQGEARQRDARLDERIGSVLLPARNNKIFKKRNNPRKAKAEGQNLPAMEGLLIRTDSWTASYEGSHPGFYSIPTDDAPEQFELIKEISDLPWTFFGSHAAVYTPNAFYLNLVDYQGGQIKGVYHYLFDPQTWEISRSWYVDKDEVWVNSGAYDPTSGLVYANITMALEHYNAFATYDINTAEASIIAPIPDTNALMYGTYRLAFTSAGELYGISTPRPEDGDSEWKIYLVKVDKTTGQVSPVGRIPLDYRSIGGECSFTIDPSDARGYLIFNGYADSGINGALYSVNLHDASVQKVYELPDNEGFKTVWFPFTLSDDVPGAVSGFSASFTDDSLDGTLTFTLPATTKSGEAMSETLEYETTANGIPLASGTGNPGETCSVAVSVPGSGYYSIGLRVRNSSGYNAVQNIDLHIGRDVPSVMKNVVASYDRETETAYLTWDTPEPQYGGFFEPEKLTYTITDYFGKVVSGVTGNSYSVHLDEPESGFYDWYFRIRPVYDGETFPVVSSNRVVIGKMTLPFLCEFTGSDARGFTFINSNEDWREWQISTLWNHLTLQGNEYKASDDWAILPPTDMKAGMAYRVNFDVRPLMPTMPETFTLHAGNDTTVVALRDNVILPETTISNSYYGENIAHAYYAPSEDGRYYFAIHAITPPQNGTLYVGSVSVDEPVSATLAAEMTDFTVTRSDDGTLKAILSFTASSTTLGGDPIASIEKIIIRRDGEKIAELQATPGQYINWNDETIPDNGTYTYSVSAVTSEGEGVACVRKAFIGVRLPSGIKWINARKGVDTGHYIVEWDSDPIDVAGDPFDEDQLKYNLYVTSPYWEEGKTVATNIAAKKRVYRVCQADDPQNIVFFGAEPVNTAGAGEGLLTYPLFVGAPDPAPFKESFSSKSPHHIYYIDYHPYYYAMWLFAGDNDFPDITSVDGDNGFLLFGSQEAGNTATYISGLIDLTGLENPEFSYFYYTWQYNNTVTLEISDGEEWIEVDSFASSEDFNQNGEDRWKRRSVDLSQFKNKIIQYRLIGKCVDALYTPIDNIRISERREIDLDISALKAKARVKAGERFQLSATVSNNGAQHSGAFVVNLYDNGVLSEAIEMASLTPGASKRIALNRVITMAEEPEHVYRMEVVCEGDEEPSNNATAEVKVSCMRTVYPEPVSLTAEDAGGKVALTWGEPDMSGERRLTVTDDVEDYTDFSIGLPHSEVGDDFVGEWTMKDKDEAPTYTFNGASMYPNIQAPMSFIVFNPSLVGVNTDTNSLWTPYSGDKMFASFLPVRLENLPFNDPASYVDKNDWLISPLLTGEAQTISFYGKTMSPTYSKERFEIYYTSSADPDPDSMTRLSEVIEADYEWEKFEFDLPEGTTYFAIRCIGAEGFVFLVDDIVYRPASASGIGLELKGYNIYRDCELITKTPVAETSYEDRQASMGNHTYHVTAVYDRGESIPAEISLYFSEVGSIEASDVKVYGGKGCVRAENIAGRQLTLQSADGRCLRSIESKVPSVVFNAPAGVYLLMVDGRGYKVIVR